jgi:hypothetical protein
MGSKQSQHHHTTQYQQTPTFPSSQAFITSSNAEKFHTQETKKLKGILKNKNDVQKPVKPVKYVEIYYMKDDNWQFIRVREVGNLLIKK